MLVESQTISMMSATAPTSEIRNLINGIRSSLETAKEDYSDIKNDENLPLAFSVVVQQFDLVQTTLAITKSHLNKNKPDAGNGLKIQRALGDGKKKASNLQTLFHAVAHDEGPPLLERYSSAASKISRGTRVELVMGGLLKDVKKMAENPAVNAATGVEVSGALNKAIEEVSELEPSLEEAADSGGPTVNVWGGVANSNFGDGKQYNNSGNATQYNAETQHFTGKV